MTQPVKKNHEAPEFVAIDQLSYEQALAELEEIVGILESNEKTLGEAMAYYQRGQELARFCASQLDQAELKIQIISDHELTDFEES